MKILSIKFAKKNNFSLNLSNSPNFKPLLLYSYNRHKPSKHKHFPI